MTLTLKAVHYTISEHTKTFIEDKLSHLDPFKDIIVNMDVTITKETKEYRVDSNVHFRWGTVAHLSESHLELYPAIENLVHKLDAKVSKEKEKVKDHKDHHHKDPVEESEVLETN